MIKVLYICMYSCGEKSIGAATKSDHQNKMNVYRHGVNPYTIAKGVFLL